MYDVIIVGGSYAGLAAALQLGRARRQVLIIDAGQRRNRFSRHSHGFLGQDGQPGEAIAAKGRSEVVAYPTVTWLEATVTETRSTAEGFTVRAGASEYSSRRLILATGVVDELPAIPGLAERWGKQVFFCPYCDGYEFGRGRLGVLATNEQAVHFALLVSEWAGAGKMTLLLNGAFQPDDDALAVLAARDIALERECVVEIAGDGPAMDVRLGDGRVMMLDGLFLHTRTRLVGSFAEQLGCELGDGHLGPIYKTDARKETTVAGVFACGDAATPVPSVSYAVADGVRAGTAAHQSLLFQTPAKQKKPTP